MPPQLIAGRYEVVRTLGQGAFARTLLARDTTEDRQVAIKVLDAQRATDVKAFELFEREAVVLRELRHHGIPQVFAAGREQVDGIESALLVMEYVEGTPLAQTIDERRGLEPSDVMHLFVELLGVLDYLHSRVPPVLHRDVKPTNIIVRPDGSPALVDFGAVRAVFLDPAEAGSTVAGTYGYMPYEQYMGQASPASDLYALGATFLHLLTGRAPPEFMGEEGRIEVPESLPADPKLRAVIARMLRPSPAERFQSAREVRDALLTSAPVSVAVAGGIRSPGVPALSAAVPVLAPAPRRIEGEAARLLKAAAPTMWQYMDSGGEQGEEGASLWDMAIFGFFSVMTAGILPATFFAIARARRRRARTFVEQGVPATAEVLSMSKDDLAFGVKVSVVSYQFEADGAWHRGVDRVIPALADLWRAGDRVPILYRPGRNYDSVIVAAR